VGLGSATGFEVESMATVVAICWAIPNCRQKKVMPVTRILCNIAVRFIDSEMDWYDQISFAEEIIMVVPFFI
jgi:hypothetical protein